ncbi:MAG: hypothetical protein ABI333_22415 [bacterium]
MIGPKEICLEELFHAQEEEEDERYVRCVALPGGEPGLALDREGAVQWMVEEPEHFALWVSADNELVLLRGKGAGPVQVERGGRSLDAPTGMPVILRDQDELVVNGKRLRLHVHGETDAVFSPERLSGSTLRKMFRAAAAAAVLALGGGVAGTALAQGGDGSIVNGREPIEVRRRPPKPAPIRRPTNCGITKQQVKGGKLVIHATCPSTWGLYAGSYGVLLDPKTKQPMPKGGVIIKSIKDKKIVAEASQLTKRVNAKLLRVWTR